MKTILALVASLVLAAGASAALTAAPTWKLKDVAGKDVSSDQFKGKVVVLDFWATWCPPCREEIPGYIELQKKYGADGLIIVGVSADQGPGPVKGFIAQHHVNYPIVMADDTILAAFGSIDEIPTTFIIDRDGHIRDKKIGLVPTADFEKRVLAVLKPSA